jgi:hypothetical protein
MEGLAMPLFLTEYASLARDTFNYGMPAGLEPAVQEQSFTPDASSIQSSVFDDRTSFVMVHAQEACCLAWGADPIAVTYRQRIGAGETRYVGIPAGQGFKVAAIVSQ